MLSKLCEQKPCEVYMKEMGSRRYEVKVFKTGLQCKSHFALMEIVLVERTMLMKRGNVFSCWKEQSRRQLRLQLEGSRKYTWQMIVTSRKFLHMRSRSETQFCGGSMMD